MSVAFFLEVGLLLLVLPWSAFWEHNYFGLLIPEEYGGAGVDCVSYALILEELSRASAAVAITVSVHNSVSAGPILMFGTDEQKRRWLPLLAASQLGAFALTEPGSGSDAAALSTRASFRVATASGHAIPLQAPQTVVDAVRDVMAGRIGS